MKIFLNIDATLAVDLMSKIFSEEYLNPDIKHDEIRVTITIKRNCDIEILGSGIRSRNIPHLLEHCLDYIKENWREFNLDDIKTNHPQ